MRLKKLLIGLIALCALGLGAALAEYDMPYYIGVDISSQIVTVYNSADQSICRQMLCSTGRRDNTPLGTFYLTQKRRATERTQWYYLKDFSCYVKWASRIHGNILFHSLTYDDDRVSTLRQEDVDKLGTPASHGCVRLRAEDARFIAENCAPGTGVRIFKSGERNEELRELLAAASFVEGEGLSYNQFIGIYEDEDGRVYSAQEVTDLQYRLHALGYFNGRFNGKYTAITIAAVRELQHDLGAQESGMVSAELLELIYSNSAPVRVGETELREGESGPVVEQLQQLLARLGLYAGAMDGIYDLEVIDSVKLFQKAANYTPDGVATIELQQALIYLEDQLKAHFGAGTAYALSVRTEPMYLATVQSQIRIILRAADSTSSDALGRVSSGDTVLVLEAGDKWAKVVHGGKTGYMMKKYLSVEKQDMIILDYGAQGAAETYSIGYSAAEYAQGAQSFAASFAEYYASAQYRQDHDSVLYATVATGSDEVRLNLRAAADAEAEVLAEVENGSRLRVLLEGEEWTLVSHGERSGYLMNRYLEFSQVAADDDDGADGEGAAEEAGDETTETRTANVTGVDGDRQPVYSDDGEELGSLRAGTQLEVVEFSSDGSWVRIRYQGKEGIMSDSALNYNFEMEG